MQVHLYNVNLNSALIYWIKDFLSDGPQKVFKNGIFPEELVLNTGLHRLVC